MNCLKSKNADNEWKPVRMPTDEEKKVLLGCVLAVAVDTIMSQHCYMVGDKIYLQTEGGSIGLEATTAIARAVMIMWDFLYLEKCAVAGIIIAFLERYVDDSNQGAVIEEGENVDEVVARLKTIADSVLPGIIMEVDMPSNHSDNMLPILDLKCWTENGQIKHQHYEKSVSSTLVISERSAHASSCKRSVHIEGCVRRMLNMSPELDWDQYFVPVLSDYMSRMAAAGFNQNYRANILKNALNIYDSKLRDDADGVKPLNRPRGYRRVERRREKREKKRGWATRGGYTAPIFCPSTPGSELANIWRKIAEEEAIPGLKFRIIERGGQTIASQLQLSNPTTSDNCFNSDCQPCSQPGGSGGRKKCHKNNIVYQYVCQVPGCSATYTGETSKNMYTRSSQHKEKYDKLGKDSFMFNHQASEHNGEPVNFKIKVIKSFRDPLSRQAAEGIFITHSKGQILNSKNEFFQPSTV